MSKKPERKNRPFLSYMRAAQGTPLAGAGTALPAWMGSTDIYNVQARSILELTRPEVMERVKKVESKFGVQPPQFYYKLVRGGVEPSGLARGIGTAANIILPSNIGSAIGGLLTGEAQPSDVVPPAVSMIPTAAATRLVLKGGKKVVGKIAGKALGTKAPNVGKVIERMLVGKPKPPVAAPAPVPVPAPATFEEMYPTLFGGRAGVPTLKETIQRIPSIPEAAPDVGMQLRRALEVSPFAEQLGLGAAQKAAPQAAKGLPTRLLRTDPRRAGRTGWTEAELAEWGKRQQVKERRLVERRMKQEPVKVERRTGERRQPGSMTVEMFSPGRIDPYTKTVTIPPNKTVQEVLGELSAEIKKQSKALSPKTRPKK